MSVYLICLTTNGGLPILTRKKGECENLPFSTVASLNGFHMFFKSLGVTLHKTYAENWTYIWKDFSNTITCIVSFRGISENSAEILIEVVFGAFSLFVTSDDMSHPCIIERLKKESKYYIPIIEAALDACINRFLGYSDCILAAENVQILQRLNEVFSVQCGSLFCCLLVGQRIAAATDGWWDLDIVDRQLLILLLQVSSNLQNDIVVYLPKKSPNVAYRFVTVPVSSSIILCVICGLEPSLKHIYDIAQNTFRSDWLPLQNIERNMFNCLPESMQLNQDIEAFVLANTVTKKLVVSTNVNHNYSGKPLVNDIQVLSLLKKFFEMSQWNTLHVQDGIPPNTLEIADQFWHAESHKCYVQSDNKHNILCVLCLASLPAPTMKYMGQKLFTEIMQERAFCW